MSSKLERKSGVYRTIFSAIVLVGFMLLGLVLSVKYVFVFPPNRVLTEGTPFIEGSILYLLAMNGIFFIMVALGAFLAFTVLYGILEN